MTEILNAGLMLIMIFGICIVAAFIVCYPIKKKK